MQIYPINTPVSIGPPEDRVITGIITGIFIREQGVNYEVSYWDERNYRLVTLHEFEIDFGSAEKQPVGFRN